jgi:hypothetical protein
MLAILSLDAMTKGHHVEHRIEIDVHGDVMRVVVLLPLTYGFCATAAKRSSSNHRLCLMLEGCVGSGGGRAGEVEVRVGAVDGHGRPVVGDGRVDGIVEGAQPVALAAVGLADLGHPLAPPALPDTAVVVARVVWATHPSLRRPRPFGERLGSGTPAGQGLLPSCCAARQYTSQNDSANQEDVTFFLEHVKNLMFELTMALLHDDYLDKWNINSRNVLYYIKIQLNPAAYSYLLLQETEGFLQCEVIWPR